MSHTRKRLKRPRRRFVVRGDFAGWGTAVHDTRSSDDVTPVAVFARKRDAQDWARQKNRAVGPGPGARGARP